MQPEHIQPRIRQARVTPHFARFLPMLLFMGLLFLSSQMPDDAQPQAINEFHLDKYLHVAAYAILALSALYALQPWERRMPFRRLGLIIFLICGLYGISDELHQSFVPGRQMSVWDLIADLIGALLAIYAWRWLKGKRLKKQPNLADST